VQRLLPQLTRRFTTYGLSPQAELSACEIQATPRGTRFAVRHAGRRLGVIDLPLPGLHNVQNTLATLCVARELEVPFEVAAQGLAAFPGIERRFEVLGEARGILVIDDYGHHPAEVRATLAAARERHPGRLVVVFQPHRYSRTRDLFDEFATAFHEADLLVLTEIYAAGEAKLPGVEARRLAETIAERGHRDVRFIADLETIPETLVPELEAGDWVIALGAGSIAALGPRLLDALSGSAR
jgi:UDP-N-acetylmuramate--alanine ligase